MKLCIYDEMNYEKKLFKQLAVTYNVELITTSMSLDDDSINIAKGCQGVSILGNSKLDESIIKKLADMGISCVSTRTIGFDHMDVMAAKKYNITLSNASYAPNNVADFTVMMMLIMLRKAKISICKALVNDFSLEGMMGREMRSLTIGIIGTGKIGKLVVKNLSGFGCKILAYGTTIDEEVAGIAQYVDLDTLYEKSDIISLHIPYTNENRHLINAQSIAKMKDGVILINTSRGGLVDSDALIEALEKEKVGGAGIDTVEDEQGIVHVDIGTNIIDKRNILYLKQFPNVLFTQHYAFFTEEAAFSMAECGVKSLVLDIEHKENPYRIREGK